MVMCDFVEPSALRRSRRLGIASSMQLGSMNALRYAFSRRCGSSVERAQSRSALAKAALTDALMRWGIWRRTGAFVRNISSAGGTHVSLIRLGVRVWLMWLAVRPRLLGGVLVCASGGGVVVSGGGLCGASEKVRLCIGWGGLCTIVCCSCSAPRSRMWLRGSVDWGNRERPVRVREWSPSRTEGWIVGGGSGTMLVTVLLRICCVPEEGLLLCYAVL